MKNKTIIIIVAAFAIGIAVLLYYVLGQSPSTSSGEGMGGSSTTYDINIEPPINGSQALDQAGYSTPAITTAEYPYNSIQSNNGVISQTTVNGVGYGAPNVVNGGASGQLGATRRLRLV
jgi:hypothetical protein